MRMRPVVWGAAAPGTGALQGRGQRHLVLASCHSACCQTPEEVLHDWRMVGAFPNDERLHEREAGREFAEDEAGAFDFGDGFGGRRDAETGGDEPHFGMNVVGVLADERC